jgi:hypothetical protein
MTTPLAAIAEESEGDVRDTETTTVRIQCARGCHTAMYQGITPTVTLRTVSRCMERDGWILAGSDEVLALVDPSTGGWYALDYNAPIYKHAHAGFCIRVHSSQGRSPTALPALAGAAMAVAAPSGDVIAPVVACPNALMALMRFMSAQKENDCIQRVLATEDEADATVALDKLFTLVRHMAKRWECCRSTLIEMGFRAAALNEPPIHPVHRRRVVIGIVCQYLSTMQVCRYFVVRDYITTHSDWQTVDPA